MFGAPMFLALNRDWHNTYPLWGLEWGRYGSPRIKPILGTEKDSPSPIHTHGRLTIAQFFFFFYNKHRLRQLQRRQLKNSKNL